MRDSEREKLGKLKHCKMFQCLEIIEVQSLVQTNKSVLHILNLLQVLSGAEQQHYLLYLGQCVYEKRLSPSQRTLNFPLLENPTEALIYFPGKLKPKKNSS